MDGNLDDNAEIVFNSVGKKQNKKQVSKKPEHRLPLKLLASSNHNAHLSSAHRIPATAIFRFPFLVLSNLFQMPWEMSVEPEPAADRHLSLSCFFTTCLTRFQRSCLRDRPLFWSLYFLPSMLVFSNIQHQIYRVNKDHFVLSVFSSTQEVVARECAVFKGLKIKNHGLSLFTQACFVEADWLSVEIKVLLCRVDAQDEPVRNDRKKEN